MWFPSCFPGVWGGWVLSWVYFLCQLSFTQLYFPSFCLERLPFSSPGPAASPSRMDAGRALGAQTLSPAGTRASSLGAHRFQRKAKAHVPEVWEPQCSGIPGALVPGGGSCVSALGWDEGRVSHPGGSCCCADPHRCITCFFPTALPEMKVGAVSRRSGGEQSRSSLYHL